MGQAASDAEAKLSSLMRQCEDLEKASNDKCGKASDNKCGKVSENKCGKANDNKYQNSHIAVQSPTEADV